MPLEPIAEIGSTLILSHLILWLANIGLTIMIILLILYKINKMDIKSEDARIDRLNLITWFFFLLLICIANILSLYHRFLVVDTNFASLLEIISLLLAYTAVFIKVAYLENVLKTMKIYKRYYFSIITFIIIILMVIVNPNEFKDPSPLQILILILAVVAYSFPPSLYLYLGIKIKGKYRTKAIETSVGLVFLGLGLFFRPINLMGYIGISDLLDVLLECTYITAPTSVLIAMFFIFMGQLESSDEGEILPSDEEVKLEEVKKMLIGTSHASRPAKITEEEVSISKEKKICLVCKGKVLGITFICRDCEAFYCEKCYQAIINIGNACWACNSALDESKPVRLPEKKETELVIEDELHKKAKVE